MLLVSILVLAAACSGGDGAARDVGAHDAATDGVHADGPAALPASEYCERSASAFCAYYLRCKRMAVADLASCQAAFLETCNARYEPTYAALTVAGKLALSASGLAACEAHLHQVKCEVQIFDLDHGCAAMWVGQSFVGQPCGPGIQTFVCASGTACVLGLDLCGTCKQAAATGRPCGAGSDITCGALDHCDSAKKVCVRRKEVGEPCAAGERCVLGASCREGHCAGPVIVAVGESCDQSRRCPYLASCIGGTCRQSALLGQPCDAESACASGRCPRGTCEALLAPGAACSKAADCVSGRCLGAAGCDELVGRCLR